jgi:hypothetical protein
VGWRNSEWGICFIRNKEEVMEPYTEMKSNKDLESTDIGQEI